MAQTEDQHMLSLCYKGWDVYQRQLVAAIAPLTEEQLALRSAPEQWSVGVLATHIIATRVGWFHGWMGEGSAELAPIAKWDEDGKLRTAAELVAGLEVSWQLIQDALARWTFADLEQSFSHPTRTDRPIRSRQYIIWHVLEHDIHHGGEISSILGAHGLAGVDID